MNSRELDAKMAELMGWRLLAGDTWVDEKKRVAHPFFRPSTDIAAAMLVLLKLEELGPTAAIRLSNGDGDSCDVDILTDMFCKLNAAHISLDGGLELLPEAICLAALKAVEDK